MNKIFLVLIMLLFTSCDKQLKIKDNNRETVLLPLVDSKAYPECTIRYKNRLFDNGDAIIFNLNIVHVTGSLYDKLFKNTDSLNNKIIYNLNGAFIKAGFKYRINETSISTDKIVITNFVDHYEKYRSRYNITILVYYNEVDGYNGVAAGVPTDVVGIQASRIESSTLPHEIGHALGLHHIFRKDDTDGYNSVHGDEVCDTPAYSLMDNNNYVRDCAWNGESKYTDEELKIVIPNYLNYNSELVDCRDKFTPVQILVQRWYVENTPYLTEAIYN